MSRHGIASDPIEFIVGWDTPLRTYFLQIIDPTKSEEEELVLWLGDTASALPALEDLAAALAPMKSRPGREFRTAFLFPVATLLKRGFAVRGS